MKYFRKLIRCINGNTQLSISHFVFYFCSQFPAQTGFDVDIDKLDTPGNLITGEGCHQFASEYFPNFLRHDFDDLAEVIPSVLGQVDVIDQIQVIRSLFKSLVVEPLFGYIIGDTQCADNFAIGVKNR